MDISTPELINKMLKLWVPHPFLLNESTYQHLALKVGLVSELVEWAQQHHSPLNTPSLMYLLIICTSKKKKSTYGIFNKAS